MSLFNTSYHWKTRLQEMINHIHHQKFDKATLLIEAFNQSFLADPKFDPQKPEFIKENFIDPVKNLIKEYIAHNDPEAVSELIHWLHSTASNSAASSISFTPVNKIAAQCFMALSKMYRPVEFIESGIHEQLSAYPEPAIVQLMNPQKLSQDIIQQMNVDSIAQLNEHAKTATETENDSEINESSESEIEVNSRAIPSKFSP